jgi:alpha-ketoglutarate-dependent taurine dioxygenase
MEFNKIKIEPLSANIGAEVQGVDLAKLDDTTFDQIHGAFLRYQVLFFRDQGLRANSIFLSVAASGNSIFIRSLPRPKAIPQ